jgi:TPP-dependent pyruvate/acetoin dehydrogenase alpha subunit
VLDFPTTVNLHIWEEKVMSELATNELLNLFRQMVLIRRFEEKSAELYSEGKIGGFLHLYIGEEAVAVGACQALGAQDHLLTAYRDHGWAIARGLDPKRVMAELLGKTTGVVGGRGGSMHMADPARHYWGGHAIVGGHLPLATGIGMSIRYKEEPQAVLCVLGEGTTNIGYFHESINLAAVWKLPVVYLVENNQYGMGTEVTRASAVSNVFERGCAYEISSLQVNGQNVLEVYQAIGEALNHARNDGPFLLEACTYRYAGHSMGDPERYRTKAEVEEERQTRDPIHLFGSAQVRAWPRTRCWIRSGNQLRMNWRDCAVCRIQPRARRRDAVGKHLRQSTGTWLGDKTMARITYREAISQALREEMHRDERVFIMGEEVGKWGGTYAVTRGFLDEFGDKRVKDTPIAESVIAGAATGAAMAGLRPVAEIMTINFAFLALDQIVNHGQAATCLMGRLECRCHPHGGEGATGRDHSQTPDDFCPLSGLKVVAAPADAKGLLKSAIATRRSFSSSTPRSFRAR